MTNTPAAQAFINCVSALGIEEAYLTWKPSFSAVEKLHNEGNPENPVLLILFPDNSLFAIGATGPGLKNTKAYTFSTPDEFLKTCLIAPSTNSVEATLHAHVTGALANA